MKADILKRLIDFIFYALIVGAGVGGYHIYNRLEAHNQLVRSLVELIDSQRATIEAKSGEVVEEQ